MAKTRYSTYSQRSLPTNHKDALDQADSLSTKRQLQLQKTREAAAAKRAKKNNTTPKNPTSPTNVSVASSPSDSYGNTR